MGFVYLLSYIVKTLPYTLLIKTLETLVYIVSYSHSSNLFSSSILSPAQFFLYDDEVFPGDGEIAAENKRPSTETHNDSTTADGELTHSEAETHNENTQTE